MENKKKISWLVNRYRDEIHCGDVVFVWRTGKDRGIRAIIALDSDPAIRAEMPSEQKYNTPPVSGKTWRVTGNITNPNVNLDHRMLREVPALENLSVFRGFRQGTNYRVTDEEGERLLELARCSITEEVARPSGRAR